MRDVLEVELLDERRARDDLLVPARTPAEECEVVDEGLRKVALVAVGLGRHGVTALGELLALLVDEQRQMRKGRQGEVVARGPVERLPEQYLLGRVREVLVATDDVGDAIATVVGDVGENVKRRARRSRDDEVVDQDVLKDNVAAHEIVDDGDAFTRRAKAQRRRGPALEAPVSTEAVVTRSRTRTLARLDGRRRAVAVVGEAAAAKHLCRDVVVGCVFALAVGPLVEVEAEPGHRRVDPLEPLLAVAALIGVLDAQYEDAPSAWRATSQLKRAVRAEPTWK